MVNNIKKCIYCKSEMDRQVKICPTCNKKQRLSNWNIALIVFVILFILGSIGSSEDEITNKSVESNTLVNTTSSVTSSSNVNKSNNTNNDTNLKSNTEIKTSSNITPEPSTNKSNTAVDQKNYTVYITKTGSKYHRSGCRYLRKSCIETTLKEALSEGYGACSVCDP